jgi:hypothetical protein
MDLRNFAASLVPHEKNNDLPFPRAMSARERKSDSRTEHLSNSYGNLKDRQSVVQQLETAEQTPSPPLLFQFRVENCFIQDSLESLWRIYSFRIRLFHAPPAFCVAESKICVCSRSESP